MRGAARPAPSGPARRRAAVIAVGLSVLLAGCWAAPEQTAQPREGRAGLQLAGTVGSRQLAVSDGAPGLTVGDCDPGTGADADVCIIADDIDGQLVVVVFENPDVLETGVTLPVVDPPCTGTACDAVTRGAVVDLQLGTGERRRARGGRLVLSEVEPFRNYVGELRLELPSGTVSGAFDVVPRPED